MSIRLWFAATRGAASTARLVLEKGMLRLRRGACWIAETGKEICENGFQSRFSFWPILAFGLILGPFLLFNDWLGQQSFTEAASARWANFALAPLYPTDARDEIVIFELDDEDLRKYEQPYPVPHTVHANIIERIAEYRPRAILVDLLFSDRREGTDHLVSVLHAARAQGIPIFVAQSPLAPPLAEVLPEIQAAVAGLVATYIEDREDGRTRYCFALDRSTSPPKCIGAGLEVGELNGRFREESAAVALYREACLIGEPLAGCGDQPISHPLRDNVVGLFWGGGGHPRYELSQQTAGRVAKTRSCKVLRWAEARDSLRWVLDWNPDLMRNLVCMNPLIQRSQDAFHLVYEVDSVIGLRPANAPPVKLEIPQLAEGEPPLQKLQLDRRIPEFVETLQGKIVLYGNYIVGSSDHVSPPTHRSLPGVHRHAMALDNLMTFGESYKSDRYCAGDGCYHSHYFEAFLFVAGYLAFSFFIIRHAQRQLPFCDRLRIYCAMIAAYLASTVILFFLFDFSPINWIGFSLFSIIMWPLLAAGRHGNET